MRGQYRDHQIEGMVYVQGMFRSHAMNISRVLHELDSIKRDPKHFKYQVQDLEMKLRDAVAAAGVLLAWEMRLGKTYEAIAIHFNIPRWLKDWRKEGWLHPKVAEWASRPTLVLCPNPIKEVWQGQYKEWVDEGNPELDMVVVDSDKAMFQSRWALVAIGISNFVVMSYDTMKHRLDDGIKDNPWGMIIFDEIQAVNNSGTWVTQSAYQLDSLFRVGLSGTPFLNRVGQLHGTLAMLKGYTVPEQYDKTRYERRSPVWKSKAEFDRMYLGWDGKQGVNLMPEDCHLRNCCKWRNGGKHDPATCMALHPRLERELMHRKRMRDCYDLPPEEFVDVEVPLTDTQSNLYAKLLLGVASWLESGDHLSPDGHRININSVLAQMTYAFELCTDARQLAYSIANHAEKVGKTLSIVDHAGLKHSMLSGIKQDECSSKLNWLKDVLDNSIDGKVLIFTEYSETVKTLAEDLRGYGAVAVHHGFYQTWLPTYVRRHRSAYDASQDFQQDDGVKVFIGNRTSFQGIELSAADHVVLYGKVDWRPGLVRQSISRSVHIEKEKPITIYNLYANRTIEVWMRELLAEKQADHDAAIDGGEVDLHSAFGFDGNASIFNIFQGIAKARKEKVIVE